MTEEAVIGVPLNADTCSLAGLGGAPLVDVMTGGTGNAARTNHFARAGVEKREERPVVSLRGRLVDHGDRWMISEGWNLAAGNTLGGMT